MVKISLNFWSRGMLNHRIIIFEFGIFFLEGVKSRVRINSKRSQRTLRELFRRFIIDIVVTPITIILNNDVYQMTV